MNRIELVPTGLHVMVHPQGLVEADDIPLLNLRVDVLAYQVASDGTRLFLGGRSVVFDFKKGEMEEELALTMDKLFELVLPLAQAKVTQDLQTEQDVLPRRFRPVKTVLEKAKKPKKSP